MLVMLGILGLVLINVQNIVKHVKENLMFEVYLNEDVKQVDINNLKNKINAEPYTKKAVFVSKDSAAAILNRTLGHDFMEVVDYNPLRPSIQIYLNADYAHPDSMAWIVPTVEADNKAMIYETYYQKDALEDVNSNITTITMWLLIFSGLLFLIAVALIHNTIRLAIYSKRFLIKTMQLVGATKMFIQKPFLLNGIAQGFLAGIVAIGLIIGILFFLKDMPEFEIILAEQDLTVFGITFGALVAVGMVLAWFSTWLAVRKYIRIDADYLY